MSQSMPADKAQSRFALELRKLTAVGNNQLEDSVQSSVTVPCYCQLLEVTGVVGTLANNGAQIQLCKGIGAASDTNRLLKTPIVDPASATPFIAEVKEDNSEMAAGTAITLRAITDADANMTDIVISMLFKPLDVF